MKALVAAIFAAAMSAIAPSFAADVQPLVVAQAKTECAIKAVGSF